MALIDYFFIVIAMEFILNNNKYLISDLEVFVDYLLVDSYFKNTKYSIHFDFLDEFDKKLDFNDLKRGAKLINDLNISFINPNFKILPNPKGNFTITYQSISFADINVGEAIPVLIVLNSLLSYKPAITLDEIKLEVDKFINAQREKFIND